MSGRRQPIRKYNEEYEVFKSAYHPYVNPGIGYKTVIAQKK